MRLLEICIVIVQSFFDFEPAFLIEFLSHFIQHMHMEINSNSITLVSDLLLKIFHHLSANTIFPVRLQHPKSQYICMFLFLKIFNSGSIGSNDNIIIVTIFGKFGILHGHTDIKWGTVLHGQGIEVYLT